MSTIYFWAVDFGSLDDAAAAAYAIATAKGVTATLIYSDGGADQMEVLGYGFFIVY